MKLLKRLLTAACMAGPLWVGLPARAQTQPLQFDQLGLLVNSTYGIGVNWQSGNGVPLSTTNNVPPGSDGLAPTIAAQNAAGLTLLPATSNQFAGFFGAAGIPVQAGSTLDTNLSFAANAANLNWPRLTVNGNTAAILRSAQVGAPFLGQRVAYLFGSVIPAPTTDENGNALSNGVSLTYWLPQPYTTNNYAGAPYYWSPNAHAVFAVQAGQINITWQRSAPTTTLTNGVPLDYATNASNYVFNTGFYYRLYNVAYIVSGAAVQPPQTMYWTEGSHQTTGHAVTVPQDRVNAVNVIYNKYFPQYVLPGDTSSIIPVTNTLWFTGTTPLQIQADNVEGRVFVELLGELNPDGVTRRYLGFEIVDVFSEPVPTDVTVNLGSRVPAYQDGRDDSALTPAPFLNQSQTFYYQQINPTTGQPTLYATHATANLTDFQMYWLSSGVAGLQWPHLFNRYHEVWPTNESAYVNYVRPAAATPAAASATSVQLPGSEAPSIAYQDPLDQPRAFVSSSGVFYTWLTPAYPAHRTLLQFLSGGQVSYELVHSWLDAGLKANTLFAGSVATNLSAWDSTNQVLDFAVSQQTPYVITNTVNVGDRITAPSGELGATGAYFPGYINQANGNSFNPGAYIDPFANGFAAASQGAIIPVNAIPGQNSLEVWWFRPDNVNTNLGFQQSYWPAAIGHYNLQWPTAAPQIIMANNAGTGPLPSLQAKGSIYRQSDVTQPGYNPNEEHAVMIAGQAYALRDDLNVTNATGYTSDPYVLINYAGSDGRPSMSVYRVRREAPELNELFDYVVNAGTILQPPMPLPLLAPPVVVSNGVPVNYDSSPAATSGDLPVGWDDSMYGTTNAIYAGFTFQDRAHNFWVYRGLNAGLPTLQVGDYDAVSNSFDALPPATAVVGQPFAYYFHTSRQYSSLTLSLSTNLPTGLNTTVTSNGLAITGVPTSVGSNTYTVVVEDLGDDTFATNQLSLQVVASGSVTTLAPLTITSTNQYSGANVTYAGRPPFLAQAPAPNNSFTMRFYYKTQAGFDWPGVANPPTNGSIVPFLRPINPSGGFQGDPTSVATASQDIVYRPVWPSLVNSQPLPTLYSGQTLTTPINGLPAVRGQSSVQLLYQQSIATNNITSNIVSAVLYDPTVQKVSSLPAQGLAALPSSVLATAFQGKYYFQNLPPNLATRVFFDPNTTNLVVQGQFVKETVGQSYLLLNVLAGADLAAVQGLCLPTDPNYSSWLSVVANLETPLYTFGFDTNGAYTALANNTYYGSNLVQISSSDQPVDSYALSATGPGLGYLTFITGNGLNPAQAGNPVTVYIMRVAPPLFPGELKVILDPNPLSENISFQHTVDLAGHSSDYVYDWRIMPPVDGLPPTADPSTWTALASGSDITHYTLGGSSGIQSLGDNYIVLRYRDTNAAANPANTNWSPWTAPVLAEGYISRVVAGINPFNQTTTDLFDNPVNTAGSIIEQAGHRWEGDVALNAQTLTNSGLIEIYETVMHRGEALSINAGYNYGPANQALLLIAGYLNDLYMDVANDAWASSLNPTISIGTDTTTYGNLATAMFTFQGEVASLLQQNLCLLRGRDDSVSPGTLLSPVYNRLFWNYTLGINSGEVMYALNYNIQDENGDGVVNAADAAILYPMGHGDAYGHYLTALTYYYGLLMNPNFDWVPQIEAVSILGATVSVNYEDERKFASSSAALARTGRQIFDLTWRQNYQPGTSGGWNAFGATTTESRTYNDGGVTNHVVEYWGTDHWASRTYAGAYLNWVVGNSILPPVDPDPTHQGIQKVDRTTVPELGELPQTAISLQADSDNAEAGFTPLNLAQNAIPFDINPLQVTGVNPQTHFEQIYARAVAALNNAVTAFNNAQTVTEELRQSQNSLADLQASVNAQELAYNNQLIELYGTPYPDDIGPGQTYAQGYNGPDLLHYTYVDNPDTNTYGGILPDPTQPQTFYVDIQQLPASYSTNLLDNFDAILPSTAPGYTNAGSNYSVAFNIGSDGFFSKPATWTDERGTVGSIQQAISAYIAAQNALRTDLANAVGDKQALDQAMLMFNAQAGFLDATTSDENAINTLNSVNNGIQTAAGIYNQWITTAATAAENYVNALASGIPDTVIAGLADGGNFLAPVKGLTIATAQIPINALLVADSIGYTVAAVSGAGINIATTAIQNTVNNETQENDLQNLVQTLIAQENALQGDLGTVNNQLRAVNDAYAAYQAQVAQGNRIQAERATFRQHAAALVQGYRTSDAAFLIFQNERLQVYTTLFNTAAEYAYLAAQAYDYETGLLNTPAGASLLNQIISTCALGVVNNGVPQAGATGTGGDPGLADALARMNGDWQVLKGRLGFNNPDGYGTTVSLRTENYRVLAGSSGDATWQQVLQNALVPDLLADADVKRYCLQIDDGSGLPVPGIELTFSTTVANGLNLFGNQLAPGDHNFSPSSFATKIFAVGVCFDGYIGMSNPTPGGGTSPPDPTLDPNGLAATPYVYLIPVGVDSMRSPPLGDPSTIRTWSVDDLAIPLPFNVSANQFAANQFYTSANSLSEPLFGVRGNQAFRPVSSTTAFNTSIYGANGALQPSQYANTRLIGRSIWNSKWKLIIPGRTLLSDPNQGLARFIQSVKDVHLYFITYSYSGN